MANGYLRIKKTDIFEDDGVVYWKNGANILGNVVKCVDSEETEHYYIESLKTRKAILLDDGVKIGGGDFGFESTNGNFILVTTDVVDFSDIGGGNGISITFTFGNKYYTVTTPENNGDLKIYDPDGEGGETGGGGGGSSLFGPYYASATTADTISSGNSKKFDLSTLYQEFGDYSEVELPADTDNEYWGILSSFSVQTSDQKGLKIKEISLKFNGNTYPSITVENDTNATITTGSQNLVIRFYTNIELPIK